jgi:hypothetical protein
MGENRESKIMKEIKKIKILAIAVLILAIVFVAVVMIIALHPHVEKTNSLPDCPYSFTIHQQGNHAGYWIGEDPNGQPECRVSFDNKSVSKVDLGL